MRFEILPLERGRCRASPGQFFLAIPPSFDPYLPRVVWPFQIQGRAVESLAVPSPVEDWERAGMLRLRGPYGRPFELPPKAGNALVICADEAALTQLTGLIAALVIGENEVVVVSPTVDWAD